MLKPKKKEKYYLILDAAVRVFAEHGFHKAHVAKIAHEAGVAGGTVYLYFKDKEDILVELFRHRLGEQVDKFRANLVTTTDARDALQRLCKLHYTEFENDLPYAHVSQLELRQSSIELRKEIGKAFKPYLILVEDLLIRGIEEKVFRPNMNVKLVRHLLFGAMDEAVTSWLISGQKYSLVEQVDDTLSFFLQGIEA